MSGKGQEEPFLPRRLSGRGAPIADLADRTPHLFKHTIGDVDGNFLSHLGGGTLYSGDQTGVVKRVDEAGCRVGARMQSG